MKWKRVNFKGQDPGYLYCHVSVVVDDAMFILGGDQNIHFDVFRFHFHTKTFDIVPIKGRKPEKTDFISAVAKENKIYTFLSDQFQVLHLSKDDKNNFWRSLNNDENLTQCRYKNILLLYKDSLVMFGG